MRYVLYIGGGIVGLVILFVVVAAIAGAFLNPAHHAERSAHIDVPTDSVYAAISDFAGYAAWRPDLVRVEMLPPNNGRPVWREYDKQKSNWAYEAIELSPPNRVKIRIVEPNAPVEGVWTISIEPEGSGSHITVIEEGVVHNVIFRFLAHTFFSPTATIESYLKALVGRFGRTVEFPPQ